MVWFAEAENIENFMVSIKKTDQKETKPIRSSTRIEERQKAAVVEVADVGNLSQSSQESELEIIAPSPQKKKPKKPQTPKSKDLK